MTVGQLKKTLKEVPDHFEIIDYYLGLGIEELDIDETDHIVYFITEDE